MGYYAFELSRLRGTVDYFESLSPAAVGVDGCFILALCLVSGIMVR